MKYGRTFNFSAGPAMMPEPVLEEIRAKFAKSQDKLANIEQSIKALG